LKFLVETGRFILTAVAVSLTVPALFILIFQVEISSSTIEIYVMAAGIGFAMAMLGGTLVGLPALWLAQKRNWHGSIVRMSLLGIFTGALAANLLMLAYGVRDLFSMLQWAAIGATAGLIAAPVWVLLHRSDVESTAV
jgi:hypothetical protein